MEIVELAAKVRTKTGSAHARNLRRSGFVPAVLYGHGMEPLSLEVSARDFTHVLHTKAGENVVVDIKADGANLKESTCVIKDIQHNPVTDLVQHIDFTVISMTEKIDVGVRVDLKHEADCLGIKAGGVLDVVHHELEVTCLPTAIPEAIVLDIKELQIGDAIHLKDIKLPEGVEFSDTEDLDEDEVVVTIHPPRVEEEPEAGEEEAAQPEVIEKGKKPEEGAEGKAEKKES